MKLTISSIAFEVSMPQVEAALATILRNQEKIMAGIDQFQQVAEAIKTDQEETKRLIVKVDGDVTQLNTDISSLRDMLSQQGVVVPDAAMDLLNQIAQNGVAIKSSLAAVDARTVPA